jgi:hypothetical protein
MCIFHKWETIAEVTAYAHQYCLGRDLGNFQFLLLWQKCLKCGEERGLRIDESGDCVGRVGIWKLKELLNERD